MGVAGVKMVNYKDIQVENSIYISLSAWMGPIKDVQGYISREFGDPVFKLIRIIFEDGTQIDVEGEHDCPYLCGETGLYSDEIMYSLLEQENEDQ